MTWAARYSRTEQPELTIWRDGEVSHFVDVEEAETVLARKWRCDCGELIPWTGWRLALAHGADDLRADIAARVPVTECEEPGCVNWAMPDGRCHHLHGGSDEL